MKLRLQDSLRTYVKAGVPAIIWGPPGVGKTSVVYALARQMGAKMVVVIASIREPVDFLGIPVPDPNRAVFHYAAPGWAVKVREWSDEGHTVLTVLDDLVTARTEVTNALLRVVLERVVGEVELGENVHIVATANPPDGVSGFPISPALANRFGHLRVEITAQYIRDWCDQFPVYWGNEPILSVNPDSWRLARAKIAAFIRSQPQLLYNYEEGELAFPTPRSWDFVSRVIAAADGIDFDAIAGLVGEAAATEFAAWFSEMNIPSVEEVLASPAIVLSLERTDQKFATISAAVAFVVSMPPKEAIKYWGAVQSAVNLIAEGGDVDVAMPSAVRLAEYYFKRGLGILPGISLSERLIAPIREAGL
jgi:hypothetical protein